MQWVVWAALASAHGSLDLHGSSQPIVPTPLQQWHPWHKNTSNAIDAGHPPQTAEYMWRSSAQSASVEKRRLRRGGRNSNAGGPRGGGSGIYIAGLQVGGIAFFVVVFSIVAISLCCVGRCWVSYRVEGGSAGSAFRTICMLLRYGCGCHGGTCHTFCLSCVWLQRHCCSRSRHRTTPWDTMEQLPPAWSSHAEDESQLPRRSSSQVSRQSATVQPAVLGKAYRAAQARTAVAPFEALPQGADSEGAMTECIICLESFAEGDPVRTLPCLHRYHKHCIDKWMSLHLSCPVCKSNLGRQRTSKLLASDAHE